MIVTPTPTPLLPHHHPQMTLAALLSRVALLPDSRQGPALRFSQSVILRVDDGVRVEARPLEQ